MASQLGQVQEQSEGRHGCSRRLFSAVEVACHTIPPQSFSARGEREGVAAGLSVCLSVSVSVSVSLSLSLSLSLPFLHVYILCVFLFCFCFFRTPYIEGSRPTESPAAAILISLNSLCNVLMFIPIVLWEYLLNWPKQSGQTSLKSFFDIPTAE